MTDREKLIELLEAIPHPQRLYPDLFVESLIAHGVTVQGWISVEDRLPEEDGSYLVSTERGTVYANHFYAAKQFTSIYIGEYMREAEWSQRGKTKVTHWMPLPQPPKGE